MATNRRVRWEAVSPGSREKIPMFRADFPGFTRKIVEHSPYLLAGDRGRQKEKQHQEDCENALRQVAALRLLGQPLHHLEPG